MLKKWIMTGICLLCLTGCAQTTFETLGDVAHQQVLAPIAREIVLQLPQDAVQAVWEGESDIFYICEDYTIHLQTLEAGDLNSSIQIMSGFQKNALTVLESRCGDHGRYEWVWTAVAEEGDLVCRSVLLDDGNFHYALTLAADASVAGSLSDQWNILMSSFCLEDA